MQGRTRMQFLNTVLKYNSQIQLLNASSQIQLIFKTQGVAGSDSQKNNDDLRFPIFPHSKAQIQFLNALCGRAWSTRPCQDLVARRAVSTRMHLRLVAVHLHCWNGAPVITLLHLRWGLAHVRWLVTDSWTDIRHLGLVFLP